MLTRIKTGKEFPSDDIIIKENSRHHIKVFTQEEIVSCERCKGTGLVELGKVTNYHDYEEKYWDEICEVCLGEGIMLKVTKGVNKERVQTFEQLQHVTRAEMRVRIRESNLKR